MTISQVLVSPNKRYICNIGKLEELNKGAFGAKFNFSDYQEGVLYYIKGTYLHELILEDNNNIDTQGNQDYKLLIWLADGNSVYFLEYSIVYSLMQYKSVFVDFHDELVYVINENEDKMAIVNKLLFNKRSFDMNDIKSVLANHNIKPFKLPVVRSVR